MKKLLCFSLLAVVFASAPAFAGEGHDHGKKATEAAASQDEMMAKWMELAAPGDHHKHLGQMVGTWNTKVTYWMAPGAPAQQSSGTMTCDAIYGGRYLLQKFTGDMMGMPFEGMGLMGYDNNTKKYQSLWIDNFSTQQMMYVGTCDGTGKTITLSGQYDDPMTKKKKTSKSVTRLESADKHVFEMYEIGPDGKEFKNMEIVYTRKG